MHSYCITLFVSRNGFIGVDKVLPLKTIDIDIMIPIISLPCRYLITYVDSVFLSCSITHCTVHLLEDLFASTINRGRKRETAGFCCKLPHLQMRSLLERESIDASHCWHSFLKVGNLRHVPQRHRDGHDSRARMRWRRQCPSTGAPRRRRQQAL